MSCPEAEECIPLGMPPSRVVFYGKVSCLGRCQKVREIVSVERRIRLGHDIGSKNGGRLSYRYKYASQPCATATRYGQ